MTQSVARALQLLSALAQESQANPGTPVRLTTLANATGLTKSTTHRLMATLSEAGFAHQEDGRGYLLGEGAYMIAVAAPRGSDYLHVAREDLLSLAEATGETVSLSQRQGERSVTIYEIVSNNPVRYANKIGRAAPLHISAGARAILAFSEEGLVEAVLNKALEEFTPATITDPTRLREVLAQTREQGYATSFGERTPGVYSISVPYFGRMSSHAQGSVSVLWPARGEQTDERRLEEWPRLILESLPSTTPELNR